MKAARLLGFLALLALCSCKSKPATLQVDPDNVRFSAAGETVLLLSSVLDDKGRAVEHDSCVYVSTDSTVAEVKLDGTVTAVGGGRTDVRVTCAGMTKVVPVKVRLPHTLKVELDCPRRCAVQTSDPIAFTLEGIGANATLKATVLDEDGAPMDAEVRFEARDPQFHDGARNLGVEVSQSGLVTALSVGKFMLLAHSGGAVGKANVEVVMPTVDLVTPEKSSVWLKPGGETTIAARTYRRGPKGLREVEGARLAWQSSDKAIVTVDEDGRLKALSVGTADVIVAADSGAFSQIAVRVDTADKPAAKRPAKTTKPKKPSRLLKKGRGR
jgi:hypothetical protein